MTRKHTILDHSIIGYFVLLIFVLLFSSIGASLIDNPLSNVIPGYAKEMSGYGITATSASGIGVGAILGAVYLRTANLWVVTIAHFTLDFAGLINGYYSSTGGLSTQLVASDWVNLVASAIGIVTALILLSPKHYPQIMKLWKGKWSC
jgi:membrane protease YdiL (CAAX protease family)